MITYWCRKESGDCLNETASIINSIQIDGKQMRYFCKSMFYCSLPKGEKKKRNWLCYSPSTGKAFCFQCKLFSPEDSAFSRCGFCDWKNATQRMVAHESNKARRDATMTLCQRAKAFGFVNSLVIDQCQAERVYAKAVHIEKYSNKGKGSVSYLSSTTCDQLIAILGRSTEHFTEEIKIAKYYSICQLNP